MILPQPNHPQIAFHNRQSWSIIYPTRSHSGWAEMVPMPVVTCPVIETTGVDQTALITAIRKYIGPRGCSDVPALIARLTEIGAVIR